MTMSRTRAAAVLSLIPFVASVGAQTLSLKSNYSGSSFFDQFNFYSGVDANSTGNVLFVSQDVATSQNLAFVDPASQNVILKADNTTVGNPADTQFGRNSIKLLSKATLEEGDLMILDAVHLPFGCSVWSGFWTQGSNWPIDGEIDIIENVNQATNNRMSLHTGNDCTHPSQDDFSSAPSSSIPFKETGSVLSTQCFNQTNGNQGCVITDPRTTSYGTDFNNGGGGAYAMLRDSQGIRIWFWPRGSLPSDVGSGSQSVDPSSSAWGDPTAFFPSSSCQTQFGSQTIYLHVDICGNFAGSPGTFAQTCDAPTKTKDDCLNLVRDPTNYNQAYFEIRSITIYSNSTSGSSSSGTASVAGATGTAGTGTGSSSGSATTGSSGSSAALSTFGGMMSVKGLVGVAAGVVGIALGGMMI